MLLPEIRSRVGFTGTQKGMSLFQRIELKKTLEELDPPFTFHHGDCIGADAQAHEIVLSFNQDIEIHPPAITDKRAFCNDWSVIHKPLPYLVRNRAIVDASDFLIACPSGLEVVRSGTWSTVRYARSKRKPVIIIYPAGTRP